MLGTAAIKAAVVGRDELIVHKHAPLTKLTSVSCEEIRALLSLGVEDEGLGVLAFFSFSFAFVSPLCALL